MKIDFREATRADVEHVAAGMREADRAECRAMGCDPKSALLISFYDSEECMAGLIDGEPVMLFGVRLPLFEDYAEIWALGTDRCAEAPVSMVRWGRRVTDSFFRYSDVLENWCDARYDAALKWLKLLGFEIGEPEPRGPNGELFCRIRKTRKKKEA